MTPELRLEALGIVLPPVAKPIGNYLPYHCCDNWVFMTQIPIWDGRISSPGRVGKEVTLERAYREARLTAINLLSALNAACSGDLSRVLQCVRLDGYVASAEGFYDQPKVLNGASDLLIEVLGEIGLHARAAIGVYALPMNCCVEISAVFKIRACSLYP